MHHVLSSKLYIAIIITLLAIASCGGRKGELRIKGEIKGLNSADLTIYSRDGVITGIDTLHVRQGKIDWSCPYSKEGGSLTIVYPTYSTLTVFGSSGDIILIEGDAKQLNSTKVSGNEYNTAYANRVCRQDKEGQSDTGVYQSESRITSNKNAPVGRTCQATALCIKNRRTDTRLLISNTQGRHHQQRYTKRQVHPYGILGQLARRNKHH